MPPYEIQSYKKLQKGYSQTFDELFDEKVIAVEKEKVKPIEPLVLVLLRLRSHNTVDSDVCDKHIDCLLLQEQTTRPGGPVRYWPFSYTTLRAYTARHTADIWLLFGQWYCSNSMWRVLIYRPC